MCRFITLIWLGVQGFGVQGWFSSNLLNLEWFQMTLVRLQDTGNVRIFVGKTALISNEFRKICKTINCQNFKIGWSKSCLFIWLSYKFKPTPRGRYVIKSQCPLRPDTLPTKLQMNTCGFYLGPGSQNIPYRTATLICFYYYIELRL